MNCNYALHSGQLSCMKHADLFVHQAAMFACTRCLELRHRCFQLVFQIIALGEQPLRLALGSIQRADSSRNHLQRTRTNLLLLRT